MWGWPPSHSTYHCTAVLCLKDNLFCVFLLTQRLSSHRDKTGKEDPEWFISNFFSFLCMMKHIHIMLNFLVEVRCLSVSLPVGTLRVWPLPSTFLTFLTLGTGVLCPNAAAVDQLSHCSSQFSIRCSGSWLSPAPSSSTSNPEKLQEWSLTLSCLLSANTIFKAYEN